MMFMHKYSFFYSMKRRLKIRKIKNYLCITNYYFMFFKISQISFYVGKHIAKIFCFKHTNLYFTNLLILIHVVKLIS